MIAINQSINRSISGVFCVGPEILAPSQHAFEYDTLPYGRQSRQDPNIFRCLPIVYYHIPCIIFTIPYTPPSLSLLLAPRLGKTNRETEPEHERNSDMALYKSPVPGTKKVRLGASTCVSALPSELVGILLENAAMLGPDYIVDRQEVCTGRIRKELPLPPVLLLPG